MCSTYNTGSHYEHIECHALCSPVCCSVGFREHILLGRCGMYLMAGIEMWCAVQDLHVWSRIKVLFFNSTFLDAFTLNTWIGVQAGKVGGCVNGVQENNNTESRLQYYSVTPSLRFSSLRYFGVALQSLILDVFFHRCKASSVERDSNQVICKW